MYSKQQRKRKRLVYLLGRNIRSIEYGCMSFTATYYKSVCSVSVSVLKSMLFKIECVGVFFTVNPIRIKEIHFQYLLCKRIPLYALHGHVCLKCY